MGTFGITHRERLGELTIAVAYAVGPHPQCIAGVALLVELAARYGIELTPRAVSLAGQSPLFPLATGKAAKEHLIAHGAIDQNTVALNEDASWSEDSLFRNSGHMVAVDQRHSLLLDPSLEQFVAAGFPNVVLVTSVDLSDSEWAVSLSADSFVVYLPGADLGGWQDHYERARGAVFGMVEGILAHLKSGRSANSHPVRLDLDGAILR
ncbi:hypothetical protein [Cryobacterium sp. MDB2-10]|uniref:hypothetical protein n=1 Tax=Cryobacterium sp. MDB2-10 TaxID=1259177 RepID=UPI00107427EA|nr:hypothetical protein [Cryobacterium sp. MDB2-10]TFC15627.1 hypothetical protein E3O51_14135 [Cryobacterium sp. MDB2-10]